MNHRALGQIQHSWFKMIWFMPLPALVSVCLGGQESSAEVLSN